MTPPGLRHHFDSLEQQHYAALLGMWVFLATEVLFFGGLLCAYTVYRRLYPAPFALGSSQLDVALGTVNTAILLVSSFTMAAAVHCARAGRRGLLVLCLLLTLLLGLGFLGIKLYEWAEKLHHHLLPGPGFAFAGPEPDKVELFFWLYFALTGLHALHMAIGVAMVALLVLLAMLGRFTPAHHPHVEVGGLYWHFVDIVWIFLYPLLYLVR